jgi:hypothetical protein
MRSFISVIIFINAFTVAGQTVSTIGEADMDGIVVTRSDTYTGQSLYGYIDGGADLYLEYGFVKLYVNEYTINNESLKAEIWVMTDGPSSYGIYAISHGSCLLWNNVSTFSCVSRYQVAASNGPLFISVTNRSGSSLAQGMCTGMVSKIIEKNPQDIWYMPPLFQSEKLGDYGNSIRYFKGPLGLQNGIPVMSDLMADLEFQMFTITINDPGAASMMARIVFPSSTSVRTFLARAQLNSIDLSSEPVQVSNGMYRSWYKVNDSKIIYLESQTNSINLKDYIPKAPTPEWLTY